MATKGWSMNLVRGREAIANIERVKFLMGSEAVQDILLPIAELIRDIAKRLVAIGPGRRKDGTGRPHLRDLIFATKGKRRMKGLMAAASESVYGQEGPSVIMGVDLKQAPHAHLNEFGHVLWAGGSSRKGKGHKVGYVAPHPFIRPAVQAVRSLVPTAVANGLKRLLAPFSSR